MEGKMNEKIKFIGLALIAGIVIGVVAAWLFFSVLRPGRTGPSAELAEANARATGDTVAGLTGTVDEQRTIIGDLQSENQRLKEYLTDASRISQSLAGTVETSGTYTASAIEVSKRLRAGIEALESWYNRLRSEFPGIVGLGDS
jgi:hypothetical protein